MKMPVNHQQLFLFAIEAQRKLNGEFGSRTDAFELHEWARKYARFNNLALPPSAEDFGIYYAPDDDEKQKLKEKGLL